MLCICVVGFSLVSWHNLSHISICIQVLWNIYVAVKHLLHFTLVKQFFFYLATPNFCIYNCCYLFSLKEKHVKNIFSPHDFENKNSSNVPGIHLWCQMIKKTCIFWAPSSWNDHEKITFRFQVCDSMDGFPWARDFSFFYMSVWNQSEMKSQRDQFLNLIWVVQWNLWISRAAELQNMCNVKWNHNW